MVHVAAAAACTCALLVGLLAGCLGTAPEAAVAPADGSGPSAQLATELVALLTTPGVRGFNITVDGEPAAGWVGVPANGTSDRLLVFAHGFGDDGAWFAEALAEAAEQGVLGVAMHYRGEVDAFKVRTGVNDTIAATLAMQRAHPAVERTVIYGVSMGGEVSGLAVAAAPPGTYDWWIDGVGVMDLATLWVTAPYFHEAIEAETGGTPTEVPGEYRARSPLFDVSGIAAQGLTRAYLVYGAADPVVPLEHAERMYKALVDARVPVTYYAVLTTRDWCDPFTCSVPVPLSPAMHEAGWTGVVLDILQERLVGAPEPAEPAVRGVYEGATGARVPAGP
ncbi:MAG TPA: prolyl oligopeptidase family serine peptidase [Candidatus Thermoplasmatota archaeon]|nr:prolyl oligopeptidase family serine peptidase [Candidatus Thermoplasmatota archaeon]